MAHILSEKSLQQVVSFVIIFRRQLASALFLSVVGVMTTLAGGGSAGAGGVASGSNDGTGTTAMFSGPSDVALDSLGIIYVADYGNYLIRKITPAGLHFVYLHRFTVNLYLCLFDWLIDWLFGCRCGDNISGWWECWWCCEWSFGWHWFSC